MKKSAKTAAIGASLMLILSGGITAASASGFLMSSRDEGNGFYVNTFHNVQFPDSTGQINADQAPCNNASDTLVGGGIVISEPSVTVQKDHVKVLYSGPLFDTASGQDVWQAVVWTDAPGENTWDVSAICARAGS